MKENLLKFWTFIYFVCLIKFTLLCWTFSLEEMDVIYCNCDFVYRPTDYKYNKNLIRYPAENQYPSIPSSDCNARLTRLLRNLWQLQLFCYHYSIYFVLCNTTTVVHSENLDCKDCCTNVLAYLILYFTVVQVWWVWMTDCNIITY